MDKKGDNSSKNRRQHSSLLFFQIRNEENKQSDLEIKDISGDRIGQRQLFQNQINQPHKIHDGDREISYKSFQADLSEPIQKSLKEINNNSSFRKSLQGLASAYPNQVCSNEQMHILSQANYDQHHQDDTKVVSSQSSRKNIILEESRIQDFIMNQQDKDSSSFSEEEKSNNENINNLVEKIEYQNQSSKMEDSSENQQDQGQIEIKDDMIFEKNLKKLGTRVNLSVKNQVLNQQETMVQQKYKQNFQKASNIISRLLNNSMNRIMRIRQNVKNFVFNLKIRHSNRRLDNLTDKEFQNINDLSHFYRQKDKNRRTFKLFVFMSKILKRSQKLALFMPTDTSRVIWDLLQVVFTYAFFYFYSIIIFFDQNEFDTNSIQQISFYAFIIFLIDILVNLNTAFFDKDIIITTRKQIAKKYFLSSIFFTDLVSMFVLGSKVIYSNSFISNNTNQSLFLFGLNILIFLKGNGISYKKKRFDYIFTLTENQKHICKLINQLASVISVAHIAAIGWYFVGVQELNNYQFNWLEKLGILQYTYYQKYIYSIYWSITTMTTVGYGDISASNSAEALYITIMMILFSCVFAYSINNIGFILQEIERSSKQLNDDITTIQRYLIRKDVNIQLKSRVRHYLSFLAQEQKDRDKQQEDKILSVLSNKLRDEITQEVNSKILNNYLIFSSNFSKQTLNKLIFIMQEILVNPNEVIITEGLSDDSSIYFIQNGIIEIYQQQIQKQNRISVIKTLTKGQIFGEISFFSGLNRQASARSVNLSTLYKINRDEFIELLKENPEDFERFKMIQDQIIFQKDITITHSECYTCKNSGHLANQCPRTHQYFDKQFVILKENFSIFQERVFKQRSNFKFKSNAKLLKKKNIGLVQRLKQSIKKENEEIYQMFTNEENLITDGSQSQFGNDDDEEEEEDSQSQITNQFEDNEIQANLKKIQQQLERMEKQGKTMNQSNSSISNEDSEQQFQNLESQLHNLNPNFIYENQDIARAKSNTINSQGYSKSIEPTDSIDSYQDSLNISQNKPVYYPESIKAIYKKETKIEIPSSMLNQEDEEGQNSTKSKKYDKSKQIQQTINAQFTDYLKSQMKQGPSYNNLNKQMQKQASNQSVDDSSQFQNQDIIIQGSKLDNNQRKSKNSHLQPQKKNSSYQKNLLQNQSQKDLRNSVEQMILQNFVSMNYALEKRNSAQQQKSHDSTLNIDKISKIQSSNLSIRSIRDLGQQKSNLYSYSRSNNNNNNNNNNFSQQDQDQNKKQQQGDQINQNQNENQLIMERISKLFQASQLPFLLQLTNGKSFMQMQESQYLSMDLFDKIQQFKKFYPENNFDKVLHKLKISQLELKKQKKNKLASKERRQNIGFGNSIRLSIFQGGNSNILRMKPQEYDINLYKPTYLSYGTKMQKGITYPINMISQANN